MWHSTPLFTLIKKEITHFTNLAEVREGVGQLFSVQGYRGGLVFLWYPNEGGPPKNEVRES